MLPAACTEMHNSTNMQKLQNDKPPLEDIVTYEETTQDLTVQCKNDTIKSIRRQSVTIVLNKNKNNLSTKTSQSFLEIVFDLMGVKKDESPKDKEIGTLILFGVMLVLFIISLTGFFVMWFTQYYDNTMLSKLILSNNSETAKDWMDPNPKYDTLLKVHIFNYTNIREYLAGIDDKIKVEDLGPLTYKEHTKKVDVSFNDNFTVTFRDHRSYEFVPEKSTMGQYDRIMVPNVPLMTASVKIDKMHFFKKIGATALVNTFGEEAFKSVRAFDFLWGYPDRIVGLDFGTGKTHFGLLMNRNGTSVDSLQINTGEDDIRKFSLITQFNGMPLLDFWSDDECNQIDGSDASMFPPHMLEDRNKLNVFLQVLCRKIPLRFEEEVTIFNNIEALRYRTPLNVFGDPEKNPDNWCYCHNTQRCMPSGVINATKCYNGAPIYPSFPHFFSGDPIIYKNFEGIKPNASIHQTYADIHPRFAFPIGGASRIQINIAVQKSGVLKNVDRIDGEILPLIWIEITSGDFTDEIIDNLYVSTFGLNAIQYALKYGTLLTCVTTFALIVAGFYNIAHKRELRKQAAENAIMIKTVAEIQPLNPLNHVENHIHAEP